MNRTWQRSRLYKSALLLLALPLVSEQIVVLKELRSYLLDRQRERASIKCLILGLFFVLRLG